MNYLLTGFEVLLIELLGVALMTGILIVYWKVFSKKNNE